MLSTAPLRSSATPIDKDLQALYNEVWAGFAEEPETPSSSTESDAPRSAYTDSDYTASPSTAVTTSSTRSTKNGSRRALPLPPTPSHEPTILMPEPEPYHELPTTNGHELNRRTTDRSNRRLPEPPNEAGNGIYHQNRNPSTSSFGRAPSYRRQPSPSPVELSGRNSPYIPYISTAPSGSDYSSSLSDNTPGPSLYRMDSTDTYFTSPVSANSYQDYVLGGPANVTRRTSDMLRDLANSNHIPVEDRIDEAEFEDWEDFGELEDDNFVNFSLLSHLAVQLKDKVPRGTQVKGGIPYNNAFTGRDVVSTIQSQIQRELALNHNVSTADRRAALQVARSLQSQLFFYEVEWNNRVLQDGVEDVYMFLDSSSEPSSSSAPLVDDLQELPTGVVTMLTRCYVPSCSEEEGCYSFSCPRKNNMNSFFTGSGGGVAGLQGGLGVGEIEAPEKKEQWINTVPKEVLDRLPESEINRQTIIHKIISKEAQYISDLDIIESAFLIPLKTASPPIISPPAALDSFITEVFGNILDIRECNRRLLEHMHVRQREMSYVIQRIGDVFLGAAAEFQLPYPIYVGNLPAAEKRLREEEASNMEFKVFLDQCSRRTARVGEPAIRMDLKTYLNRPSEHLQKYPVLLEAIFHETVHGNPDADFLLQAIEAMKGLQTAAQLRTFQIAMGKGPTSKWDWSDLVGQDVRKALGKEEAKRQSIIFELIKGEMAYVKDLENVQNMYIIPLRESQPSIIPSDRVEAFIKDVFHNITELYLHHQRLLENLHDIQRRQHPTIRSVTAAMLDGALNFREAYMEYIPNYPIAAYRIDEEMVSNPSFKSFVEQCTRHPDAHRLDMKNFINRPIPRLLRYELLLKNILDETPPGHDDKREIPQVLEVIKSLGKDTEPGVVTAKQKVELWRYNSGLVFKPGEWVDLDLLDEQRSLIYSGKLLRQPDGGLEWNGWSELYVLLFDNYMVLTKPKEKDGVTKFHVNRRPIPLDLLTLVNFTEPSTPRGTGLLRTLRANTGSSRDGSDVLNVTSSTSDSANVYPITLHHTGRVGGAVILFAESAQSRTEWKTKLEEALGIRKVVQESNKVFEIETLSSETFIMPNTLAGPSSPPSWTQENSYTGRVTCSVPFNTADGRGLVAIGCAEGVWIGFRHDPKSMRRVLHLKMVTQCAMLEEFGIFLVLADKSLFAYHIEALVPSTPLAVSSANQVPQKLNGNKDVHFFSVGQLHGRTLIIYMKKKGMDSIFRVLEPVGDKINERIRPPTGIGTRLFRNARSEWFRIYRDFFLPSESFDLVFLKARIAILCTKGFEIMDLNDFKSVTIPASDDPRQAALLKRCESCRPLGMFRSTEDEFLLVYDEFGIYVDKHGDPRRSQGTIEWEGRAERVALHHPYILLFDSRFIEVRHVETGRLSQIIPGNDIRCIWDGRGVGTNVVTPSFEGREDMMVQDAQVHAVMDITEPGRVTRTTAQHVFELLPTVLLYPPGSQPELMGYPQSYSPPHSPLTRDSSWRS